MDCFSFFICIFLNLTFFIRSKAGKPGILNSIDLGDSNYKIKRLQDSVFGIDIIGYDQNFQLILAEGADQFVNDKLLDSGIFYVNGKCYVQNQQIGSAFGEIGKGKNPFFCQILSPSKALHRLIWLQRFWCVTCGNKLELDVMGEVQYLYVHSHERDI